VAKQTLGKLAAADAFGMLDLLALPRDVLRPVHGRRLNSRSCWHIAASRGFTAQSGRAGASAAPPRPSPWLGAPSYQRYFHAIAMTIIAATISRPICNARLLAKPVLF
jgi:hypothetical protein